MLNINFCLLHPDAKVPTYGSQNAACFDLYSVTDVVITGNRAEAIRTGLAVEVPDGYSFDIRGRSGMAFKQGLWAFHGTVDADYRGEILVLVQNIGRHPVFIPKGSRIAQARLTPSPRVTMTVVEQLSFTERGEGGFGSSGK